MDHFYNYIKVDLRRPGKFTYSGLNFSLLFEPFYVGEGHGNRAHHSHKGSRGRIVMSKITKMKKLNLKSKDYTIFVMINVSETLALASEAKIIASIGRKDLKLGPLLNRTNGGIGYTGMSDAAKKKLSRERKGKKISPEQLAYRKILNAGENNPMFGRKQSQLTKDKISAKAKNRKPTKEHKEKTRASMLQYHRNKRHDYNPTLIQTNMLD